MVVLRFDLGGANEEVDEMEMMDRRPRGRQFSIVYRRS